MRPLVTAALLLALVTPAFADGFYSGFAPGSFVVLRETHRAGGRAQSQVTKHVVLNAVPNVAVYPQRNGTFAEKPESTLAPSQPATPMSLRMKVSKVGEQTLSVGGKAYPCKVTTYESPMAQVTYWTAAGADVPYYEFPAEGPDLAVPPHTIKVQYVVRFGTDSVTHVYEVVSFDAPLKVGDREVRCVQQRITGDGKLRGVTISATGLQWLTNQVPGKIARLDMEITRNGVTGTLSKEAIDFGNQ